MGSKSTRRCNVRRLARRCGTNVGSGAPINEIGSFARTLSLVEAKRDPFLVKQRRDTRSTTFDILHLPSKLLHRIFFLLDPGTFYGTLPLVCRGFYKSLAPHLARIPVNVTITYGECCSVDVNPSQLSRKEQRTYTLADSFHALQLGFNLSQKPVLKALDGFDVATVEDVERNRAGPATPPKLRDRMFYKSFPWALSQNAAKSAMTSTWDPSTLTPVGAHLTVNLKWNKARKPSHIIPSYRDIDNLPNLAIDAAESFLRRRFVVAAVDTLVITPSGTCLHSVESIVRGLKPERLVVHRGNWPLRWDGSDVAGVRALKMSVCCHREMKGVKLDQWKDLERISVEAYSGDASMAHLLAGVAMEGSKSKLTDLHMRTKRGKFDDPLGLVLILPSLVNLTRLQLTNWHLPFQAMPESDFGILYDAFTSLPSKLPNLTSFGDILYLKDRFVCGASKGGYKKLEELHLRVSDETGEFDDDLAEVWADAGFEIAWHCPNLRRLYALGNFGASITESVESLVRSVGTGLSSGGGRLDKVILSVPKDAIEDVRDLAVKGVSGFEVTAELSSELWEQEGDE